MCYIPLAFDPKAIFGKTRVPVKVTVNGYTTGAPSRPSAGRRAFRLRKSHREAAGLEGGETLPVRLELDTDKREVTPPPDFIKALRSVASAWEGWCALSYTHQREHVEAIEGAKRPETRTRRIERALQMIAAARKLT